MKTSKDRAIECYEILKLNNDLNLSDGLITENPQIKNRIITEIERACLRVMEDTLKRLNNETNCE